MCRVFVGKAAVSQSSRSLKLPSLCDVPKQESTTPESCLFLDVLVSQAIYELPRWIDDKGKGGDKYFEVRKTGYL